MGIGPDWYRSDVQVFQLLAAVACVVSSGMVTLGRRVER